MWKIRTVSLILIILAVGVGFFVYKSEVSGSKRYGFHQGLDLKGGTHLVYNADTTALAKEDVRSSMDALRDVIERRVNLFGVSEPIVQVQEGGFTNGEQLIVDLPGVTDVEKATAMIGQTPLLEFKTENPKLGMAELKVGADGKATLDPQALEDAKYINSELTGRYLKKAYLEFDPNTHEPRVSVQFDDAGSALFEKITKENIGKTVAIYLDGSPISTPVVREAISGGRAVISGNFTPNEAKLFVGRLNSGALPVPISLVSTESIGASLGEQATHDGVKAALIGFLAVALFLIFWYRLPGLIAILALSIYVSIMLALFKLVPVTLTAAGIAGFIITIGTAVDGNILIFERIKEEIRAGRTIADAIKAGFERAWFSIRDSNSASIISGLILFWVGTPLMKGFALTLVIGMIVSLVSAVSISKAFMYSLRFSKDTKLTKFLFGSGFSFNQKNN